MATEPFEPHKHRLNLRTESLESAHTAFVDVVDFSSTAV